LFAAALVSTLGLVGAAVDYSRANATKVAFQAALDATVLAMAGRAADITKPELETAAEAHFNALFANPSGDPVDLNVDYTTTAGSQITISGSTVVKTQFLRLPGLGINEITIGGTAQAKWGNTRMRVAMALDNTGSMADNGKMDALKVAAKNLIDQLKLAASKDGDVYVSIIPFSKDVNVGPDNRSETWLKWSDWLSSNGTCSSTRYKSQSSCEYNGKVWTPASDSAWNGCVEDRDQSYDTTNDPPVDAATRFPTEQYSGCPVAIMPLSYDWDKLKEKIDAMQPAGNTNTTIGFEWAWHSLTPGAPLNPPAEDPNYSFKKVIIFLTDGLNTQNRWNSTASKIDERMKLACENAKAKNVVVYTVLVIDGNADLLKACASGSDKYHKVTSSGQLSEVFSKIGTNLTRLHIAQ
jgi:uncharacterized protein YegL